MNLFNEDNVVGALLNRIGDIVIANLLFLACCIPVVTIGPALTALYHCTLRMARGDSVGIVITFFRALRENFRQSLAAWCLFLAAQAVLLANLRFLLGQTSAAGRIFLYLSAAAEGFAVVGALYLFPVIAAFRGNLKKLIGTAYFFAFRYFLSTIAVAMLTLLPMTVMYRDARLWPLYAFCWFFFGFALTALLCSLLLYRLFRPYLEKGENKQDRRV